MNLGENKMKEKWGVGRKKFTDNRKRDYERIRNTIKY